MTHIHDDPYYSSAYTVYGSVEKMIEAGYIDVPRVSVTKDTHQFLSTPVQKIIDRLDKNNDMKQKPIILVTSGGFSPIHNGHLHMLELAKTYFESHNRFVAGGYISPSHDEYVKYAKNKHPILPSPYRIRLCELAVAGSDWLMVDSWESRYQRGVLNFTEVCTHIRDYCSVLIPKINVDIAYVFGSDNAAFARAFVAYGSCVCVKRKGFEKEFDQITQESHISGNDNIVFLAPEHLRSGSSTDIHTGNYSELPASVESEYISITHNADSIQPKMKRYYAIRQDGDYAVSRWPKFMETSHNRAVLHEFYQRLSAIIEESFRNPSEYDTPQDIEVVPIDITNQQRYVDTLVSKKSIVNIDSCTTGGHRLEISRLFALSDGQCFSRKVVNRPGSPALAEQFRAIPKGEYVLVDDDVLPESQYDRALHALPDHIRISKTVSLLQESVGNKDIYDVVDGRDFLLGSRDGGLVVDLPNGQIARAPYMLPYVSLATRARVYPSAEKVVSTKLWELNLWFFQSIHTTMQLVHTDSAFQGLMQYIGFHTEATMVEICAWHIDHLRMNSAFNI